MQRIKLKDRELPDYTRGEEIFNMVSHIVGGGLSVAALVICIVISTIHSSVPAVLSSIVYGVCAISLYTMSSIYHGLCHPTAKKVFQVIDHCTIYFMIAGTYTPITVVAISKKSMLAAWLIMIFVWGLTAVAVTLTAIDLKKYRHFSMFCYLGIGWSIIFAIKPTFESMALPGFILLFLGGIFYTVGSIFYAFGKRKRYIHSVFHLFVLLGSIAHFFCIALYIL